MPSPPAPPDLLPIASIPSSTPPLEPAGGSLPDGEEVVEASAAEDFPLPPGMSCVMEEQPDEHGNRHFVQLPLGTVKQFANGRQCVATKDGWQLVARTEAQIMAHMAASQQASRAAAAVASLSPLPVRVPASTQLVVATKAPVKERKIPERQVPLELSKEQTVLFLEQHCEQWYQDAQANPPAHKDKEIYQRMYNKLHQATNGVGFVADFVDCSKFTGGIKLQRKFNSLKAVYNRYAAAVGSGGKCTLTGKQLNEYETEYKEMWPLLHTVMAGRGQPRKDEVEEVVAPPPKKARKAPPSNLPSQQRSQPPGSCGREADQPHPRDFEDFEASGGGNGGGGGDGFEGEGEDGGEEEGEEGEDDEEEEEGEDGEDGGRQQRYAKGGTSTHAKRPKAATKGNTEPFTHRMNATQMLGALLAEREKNRAAEAAAAAQRDAEKHQLSTVLSDLVSMAKNAAKMVADASAAGSSSSAAE